MAENGAVAAAAAPPAPADSPTEQKTRSVRWRAQHALVVVFFVSILVFHALAISLFCTGFLLSRLVLPDRSECALPPVSLVLRPGTDFAPGSPERGCWHPRAFAKAVVVVVDALRYDFAVPFPAAAAAAAADDRPRRFHNALPVLYETAARDPHRAFLRPFIADPPTTTLQRLKGLTTGTLPTFIDAGSNFAGTAVDEDNLVEQLVRAGRRLVHLGDDTWHSLFPGAFEPNLTRPYDSFNVWDLHTVDDGVTAHLFPLLRPSMAGRWDVVFAHYLGVDHAGHRYGPDHPAMADKLRQMDAVVRRLIAAVDDDTLLVVMGDHGMDPKGDHGGESDDEVEAALWMYSKRGVFGRADHASRLPPRTAKDRPVNQIDLVPTLSLLLGLPIPFNNLGRPVEEAFHRPTHPGHSNLADVTRLTAAQIHRYQAEYAKARKTGEGTTWAAAEKLWSTANAKWDARPAQEAWESFVAYQAENLRVCKSLWARFDLVSMSMGLIALAGTFAVVLVYAHGITGDRGALTPPMLGWGLMGSAAGAVAGAALGHVLRYKLVQLITFGAAMGGIAATLFGLWPARALLKAPLPSSFWGMLSALATVLLCIGFASNSFTVWEDEQLLFLLSTFGLAMLGASLGQPHPVDRKQGAANALLFLLALRLSSLSRLCREEQMPFCRSSYYASATSSTSSKAQLAIPFAVALVLPAVVVHYYKRSANYHGSAVVWNGIVLRLGLIGVASFWAMDAADDGGWFPDLSPDLLKTGRMYLAQGVLALAFAAGYATYIWASPLLMVKHEEAAAAAAAPDNRPPPAGSSKPTTEDHADSPAVLAPPPAKPKIIIYGFSNAHGTRYFLLPCAWILALLLLQKPMGQGALALCFVQILNVLEVVDACDLRRSPLAPVVLALLGSFHFFKTGHQAALVTIQWESAFVPLKTVQYPWSPLLVTLNTFGPQVLCAIAVPAVALWKVPPKHPGVLGGVAGSLATHILFYAAVAVASAAEAAWLRRHLMLYRVFMPRMLLSVVVLVLVELVSAVVAAWGARWSIVSVYEVFGWPE